MQTADLSLKGNTVKTYFISWKLWLYLRTQQMEETAAISTTAFLENSTAANTASDTNARFYEVLCKVNHTTYFVC